MQDAVGMYVLTKRNQCIKKDIQVLLKHDLFSNQWYAGKDASKVAISNISGQRMCFRAKNVQGKYLGNNGSFVCVCVCLLFVIFICFV